jgi:hypothetical protein
MPLLRDRLARDRLRDVVAERTGIDFRQVRDLPTLKARVTGIGLDRCLAPLTDAATLRDAVLFPAMRGKATATAGQRQPQR